MKRLRKKHGRDAAKFKEMDQKMKIKKLDQMTLTSLANTAKHIKGVRESWLTMLALESQKGAKNAWRSRLAHLNKAIAALEAISS